MVAEPEHRLGDPRPYVAIALMLVVAFGMNLVLWNPLWLGYTIFGAGIFAGATSLAWSQRIVIPPATLWLAGLAGAMHYIGGSLSGLHLGRNGLYYAFPWWDNLVHSLGAFAIALVAAAIVSGTTTLGPRAAGIVAWTIAVAGGTLVELYEFFQFQLFGTLDQGFYSNTMWDLYDNALGAGLGGFVHARTQR